MHVREQTQGVPVSTHVADLLRMLWKLVRGRATALTRLALAAAG